MNCKPGDLAIIIAGGVPENYGRVIRVIRFVGAVPFEVGGDYWLCATDGAPCMTNLGRRTKEGFARDVHLLPVSGLPVDDIVDAQIKEFA